MLFSFDALLIALAVIALFERIWKHACVVRFFGKEKKKERRGEDTRYENREGQDSPFILHPSSFSILQPILSGDVTLPICLRHNLQLQTEHELEYVWLLDEDDAEAGRICGELKAEYTDRNIRIVLLPPPADRHSPKMVKLIAGAKLAIGEVVCVLDDDTMLPDDALETCLMALEKPKVGLAFGLPCYVCFGNMWSALVACFVNSHSLLTYIPYTFLIEPFTINGMFYVVRRNVLDKVGGFNGLETSLMDDFAVAQRFRQAGYQLAQTRVVHGIATDVQDMRHYMRLLNRWFIFPRETIMKALPLRELAVAYGLGLIATLFPLLWLIASLAMSRTHSRAWMWGVEGGYIAYSYLIFAHFNKTYLRHATPWRFSFWVPIIQLLLPVQLLAALLSPQRIEWRGHVMQIERGGTFRFVSRRAGKPQP